MPRALEHACNEDGQMRIVRNPRRARLLKRRGVKLDYYNNPLADTGAKRFWVWFETNESFEYRAHSRRLAARHIRKATSEAKLRWVDAFLRKALSYRVEIETPTPEQRAHRGSPRVTLYYQL